MKKRTHSIYGVNKYSYVIMIMIFKFLIFIFAVVNLKVKETTNYTLSTFLWNDY